jgi:hypothetical protein
MNLVKKYRSLSENEIKSLESNGCSSHDWNRISVLEGFDPSVIRNVIFSGDIKLGIFSKPYIDDTGVTSDTGIRNAKLHNCIIGSDVVINNIGEYIANYDIQDETVIINCGKIFTEGISGFGNGTEVTVLNEAGGRTVKIWDRLSAHEAYILALYRHKRNAIRTI